MARRVAVLLITTVVEGCLQSSSVHAIEPYYWDNPYYATNACGSNGEHCQGQNNAESCCALCSGAYGPTSKNCTGWSFDAPPTPQIGWGCRLHSVPKSSLKERAENNMLCGYRCTDYCL